jgi:hypothetical protein
MKTRFLIRYHHDIVTVPIKIDISVTQDENTLYHQVLDLRCYLSPLMIEFEFRTLAPIKLTFETDCTDIQNSPLYIDRIEFDGLLDIPFVVHAGLLQTQDFKTDTGNCLYTTGGLSYNFSLPLCSNCGLFE